MSPRFLAFIFAIVALPALGALPPDDQVREMLIGTWVVPVKEYNGAGKQGSFTFNRDGTFTYFDVFQVDGRDVRTDVSGKWSIKDGTLIEQVTSSTNPQFIPVGVVMQAPLLSITDNEYRYRVASGVEHTRVRK
jgi:hypothetical protein